MTVTYLGALTIGDSIPAAVAVSAAAFASLSLALPDIEARIEALLAFSPGSVDFSAQLTLALQIVASIQSAISIGLTPPSIAVQIALITSLLAALEALLASINVQLGVIVDFNLTMGTGGIFGYAFEGQTGDFGSEFATEFAGGTPGGAPTDLANALVLITTTPATWAAMASIFKVTP